MDATTSADVAGDSFRDLRVLLYGLRSPLAAARVGAESLFVWIYPKSRTNAWLEMCSPPQCELRKILSYLALLLAGAANHE